MKISDYIGIVRGIANGELSARENIYGTVEFMVHRMHLSDDTDIELHYQQGELVNGFINSGDKTFQLDDDELEASQEAYNLYRMGV